MARENRQSEPAAEDERWLSEQIGAADDAGADRAVELARLAARAEADLAALGGALDVEPGSEALKRAKAAAWAESSRRRYWGMAYRGVGAVAGVAAVVFLAVVFRSAVPVIVQPTPTAEASFLPFLEALVAGAENFSPYDQDDELAEVSVALDRLEMDIAEPQELASEISDIGAELEELEAKLGA